MAWKYVKVAPVAVSVYGDEHSRKEALDIAEWKRNLPGSLAFTIAMLDRERIEARCWRWTAAVLAVIAVCELAVILWHR